MESTFGLYKTELINQRATGLNWSGRREVERETAEWVRWFNTERIHSSLDYVTPIEREVMHTDTLAQRAEAA
jgi:transposase InsO family protein